MSIGRNYPCTCGSGKKYKKCCLNWQESWSQGIKDSECEQQIKNILKGAFDFIVENNYQGGCHLISAILYVLLSEQGYNPVVKIGEVMINDFVFDHSWLELDGKIIDIAIMNTLDEEKKMPPVIMGKSASTGAGTTYQYGISPNLDITTQLVIAQSIGQYLIEGISQGSLRIMKAIMKKAKIDIKNIDVTLEKYMNSYRIRAVAIPRGIR